MKPAYLLLAGMVLSLSATLTGCGGDGTDDVPAKQHFNRIKGVVSYRKEFNDLNDLHLSSARTIGVTPITSRSDLGRTSRQLMWVDDNKYYEVDRLTHSVPYLVPRASAVLMAIAMNFSDSLEAKGIGPHKLIVTSVLRTQNDVKRLRKSNANASLNSAHFYGTTFDISYNRFVKTGGADGDEEVRELKLKLVLSEVLKDMRDAGLCYVKHELRQGCFHITAR